jgi:hypothetical protein
MNANASLATLGVVLFIGCATAVDGPRPPGARSDVSSDAGKGVGGANSASGSGGGATAGGASGRGAAAGAPGTSVGAGGAPAGGADGGVGAGASGASGGAGRAGGAAGVGGFGGAGGAGISTGTGGSSGLCNPAAVVRGAFSLLTYNVAGLPEGISQSHPLFNLQKISPLLNGYNLAVVQENFTFQDYPQKLRSAANHPYKSTPKPAAGGTDLGDGLNYFSELCFEDTKLYREAWKQCFGQLSNSSDCLTSKGFAVVEVHLARGVAIDLYDVHMDAGGASQDVTARAAQVEQLLARIASQSAGRAIIVGGDTNMGGNEAALAELLTTAKLSDSCRTLSCGDERIDRIMFRSSTTLELKPSKYRIATEFVDGSGQPLSDHEAVAVDFEWQSR